MGALIRNGHDNFLDVKDEEVPTCRHTGQSRHPITCHAIHQPDAPQLIS